MSTVGYGDLAPKTVIGRLDAVALMVIGIGFFALLTGAVAQRFLATQVHQDVQDAEAEMTHDVAAARETVLTEIRAISDRLRELEQTVEVNRSGFHALRQTGHSSARHWHAHVWRPGGLNPLVLPWNAAVP